VSAETELHHPIRGKVVVALGHQHLHRDARLDGPYNARELEQETVTGILHKPAAVIENDRIYRASMGLEGGVRALLVGTHHARVAGNVCADYGG
jgi:hypothetical protein